MKTPVVFLLRSRHAGKNGAFQSLLGIHYFHVRELLLLLIYMLIFYFAADYVLFLCLRLFLMSILALKHV